MYCVIKCTSTHLLSGFTVEHNVLCYMYLHPFLFSIIETSVCISPCLCCEFHSSFSCSADVDGLCVSSALLTSVLAIPLDYQPIKIMKRIFSISCLCEIFWNIS